PSRPLSTPEPISLKPERALSIRRNEARKRMPMELYQLFAQILGYPTPSLPHQINECISLLTSVKREAVPMLDEFRALLEVTPLDRMEEVYTRTFDLQAICQPYVGCQLFGNGSQRGMFMAGLKEHYETCEFSTGNELPDHLSTMLRFAPNCAKAEREELISECLVPAVKKMVSGFEDGGNPYRGVLQALLLVLQTESEGFHDGR
ncbi:MAG TPA: molecular chaperone TorD family protein, partial [Thermodesulfobacteriota bacterium]|nr:molecular chaperone TorD family protein [Thermodesulfobacteriota bacterium]